MGRLLDAIRGLPEEVWFFLRIAAYAFFIGTVYWFLTYEAAGTMLLLGFGLAAGFGTVILALGARARRTSADRGASDERIEARAAPDGPFGDERGRIPGASVAPLVLGVGVALAGLGLVFGPWLTLAGAAIGLVGAIDWGRSASAEYRAVEAESDSDSGSAGSVERVDAAQAATGAVEPTGTSGR